MTRIGTHCFVSLKAAINYYNHYGFDSNDVADKIDCNEIVIGEPELKQGEKLLLNKAEGRYFIETAFI